MSVMHMELSAKDMAGIRVVPRNIRPLHMELFFVQGIFFLDVK